VLDVTLIGVKSFPKRAKAEIERLRQEVAHWRAKALAAAGADPDSTNVMVCGGGVDPDSGLPPNSSVIFRIDTQRFRVGHEHGVIAIRALDGLLVVRPVAANVVHVKSEER